jgi:hypothetical protein
LAGVPMSLVGYANLTAPSKSDPTKSIAAEAAVRMADAARPMPPGGGLSAQELATMQNWVAQGTPRGTCGGAAGPVSTGGMSSSGSAGAGPSTGSGAASTTGSGGTTGGTVTGSGTGIPCGVAQMLNARCVSCHGTTLAGGAPMSLVTYADLTRASIFFAGQTNIQRAAARIVDTARPMPPGGGVTSTEVAAVQSWVAMGAPRLDCATPPGGGTTTGTGGASGSGTGTGTGTTGTAGTTGTGTTTPSSGSNADVPCAVAQLLAGSCLTCHGVTPVAGAPMSLVSYADLTAPSRTNPAISTVRQAVARMGNAGSPMPPGGGATAAQILVLQDWINAGTPRTACTTGGGVVVPPNPFNTPLVCTSRTTWTGGDNGNPLMHPGGACINCHRNNGGGEDSGGDDDDDAPQFVIAGTVYPTAHEPNDCNGGPAGGGTAQVILTGANGQTVTLTTNAAGNFFTTAAVSFPFRAQVVYQGRVRAMSAAQSNGDCNSCHTVNGANGAPGRIMLP